MLQCSLKLLNMKTLDLNAMENIQGGQGLTSGLPIADILALVTGLVSGLLALGLGTVASAEAIVTELLGSVSIL